VVGTDVNGGALRFAALNAAAAGVTIEALEADTPSAVGSPLDLAIANPPYIIDAGSRTYRDGGALHGGQVSVDMVADALPQLSADGRMILYTGSAIVAGRDSLHEPLLELAAKHRRSLRYSMIDPDVFGEELEKEAYRDVERIALVAAVFEPPSPTARNEFPLRSL
jgi:methylase of polypeptide subunit release factors